MTNAKEAIERLDDMQKQIIHGKRTFGDIADVIRDLVKRDEQWNEKWKIAAETNGSSCGEILKLQAQADECRKLLGYDDGDLLDNVTRYKKYAESEIALRDEKAKMGIAYIEKLQAALRGFLGDGEIELEIKAAREVLASGLNDPSSATRRTGRNDCNRDAPAGFAAAHG